MAKLCHEYTAKPFVGFTHHDIHVRWRSDFMHYAYKKSTHPDMYVKYHRMAIKSRGPKSCVPLPTSLPIHPKMPIFPAIDRLKNYSKDDFDFTLINTRNRTLKYRPPDDDIEHDQLLDSLAGELHSSTQAHIHDQFSQSISDSVFETMTESKKTPY